MTTNFLRSGSGFGFDFVEVPPCPQMTLRLLERGAGDRKPYSSFEPALVPLKVSNVKQLLISARKALGQMGGIPIIGALVGGE
jgi:hypothetical protein